MPQSPQIGCKDVPEVHPGSEEYCRLYNNRFKATKCLPLRGRIEVPAATVAAKLRFAMRISILMGALGALLLAGCAPRYIWANSSLAPGLADREREIDSAECTMAAMHAVPLPDLPAIAAPAPSGYAINGTTTFYGPNGEVHTGYYSGTATGNGNMAQAGANAYVLRQASLARGDAVRARANFAAACMMTRGWARVKSDQQPSLMSAVQTPETSAPNRQNAPTSDGAGSSPSAEPPFKKFDDWKSNRGH